MPRGGDIFGRGRLFGVDIHVVAGSQAALEAALALFPAQEPGFANAQPSITIRLEALPVDAAPTPDHFAVEQGRLTLARNGFLLRADSLCREGACFYPGGRLDDVFSEMVNTLVLFLVAQAGRTPLHASAVMLGDMALVLAGPSGSGKSSLALAADRAGFGILSDDTVYVQTDPDLRIWALPRAIHVFEKDAPQGAGGVLRYRGGRWKQALPITTPWPSAARSLLCVITRGTAVGLEPLAMEDALRALTAAPEPGYDFYGPRLAQAVRALARDGCWRLTLSEDPAEAVAYLQDRFGAASPSFHQRYVSLVTEIETRFPVAQWRMDDMPVWPLARFELYVDMHRAAFGGAAPPRRPLALRLGTALLRPLINRWRARRDAAHQLYRARPAHAVLLGDGLSLDRVDGAYQDRFGEPVIAALERQGKPVFVMQPGDLRRLPWRRETFAISAIEASAFLKSLFRRDRPDLPGHAELMAFLVKGSIVAPSLAVNALTCRVRLVMTAARLFESILYRVRPAMAFTVNAAAGLGPAFVLACRRIGILSIDLQRCPRAGAPMSHGWSMLPSAGYATLPSVFWSWDADENPRLPLSPWHHDLHGGHAQLAPFLDDDDPVTKQWDAQMRRLGAHDGERNILVALQPIGSEAVWNALADAIAQAPPGWRWWIRSHPAMQPGQEQIFGRLFSLRGANILIDPAPPLPALLRHMAALVSLSSGAAVEASLFGVPALFLSSEAQGPFGALLASGAARLTTPEELVDEIAGLAPRPVRTSRAPQPPLRETLQRLEIMARDHARLCTQVRA